MGLFGGGGAFGGPGSGSNWRKFTITNADVVALGAALTGDITLFALGANEILENLIANVTAPGAGTTTLTMAIGKTAAAYTDVIPASDVKTAAVVLGQSAATRAAATLLGDTHAVAAATYKAHFISTVENLSEVTGFACTIYYKVSVLP